MIIVFLRNNFCNITITFILVSFFLLFVVGSSGSVFTWNGITIDKDKGFDNEIGEVSIFVSKDGVGHSHTVQGAVDLVPIQNSKRVKIYILPGFYKEKILIPFSKSFISFIGNPNFTTIISWNDKASDIDNSTGLPIGTYGSASVAVESDYFHASDITFENTSPEAPSGSEGLQAVALRVTGENAVFIRCSMLGFQDTLFDHIGTHLFFRCYVRGSVDFIFGSARSLYEECIVESNARTFGAIAASQRNDADDDIGFTFSNSNISGTGMVYLGRAWGRFSTTIYAFCHIDNIVIPSGWSDWGDSTRQLDTFFVEYNCTGLGADQRNRVPWMRNLTYDQVKPFLGQSTQIDDQVDDGDSDHDLEHKGGGNDNKVIYNDTPIIFVNRLTSIFYGLVFYILMF